MMPWFSQIQRDDPEVAKEISDAAALAGIQPDTVLCGIYAGYLSTDLEPDEVRVFAMKIKRRGGYNNRMARKAGRARK